MGEHIRELQREQQKSHATNINNLGTAENTSQLQAQLQDPHDRRQSSPGTAGTKAPLEFVPPREAVSLVESCHDGLAELSQYYHPPELEGSNVPELDSNGGK